MPGVQGPLAQDGARRGRVATGPRSGGQSRGPSLAPGAARQPVDILYVYTYNTDSGRQEPDVPRPNQTARRKRELLPILARAFAELSYRRTTTAALARRCGVRENVLYRLWPDKRGMFIAAIDYVYDLSAATWGRLLAEGGDARAAARRLLDYESGHHGEFGHYRIVFAGLSETDDPAIRAALRRMFGRFHRFLGAQIAAGRGGPARRCRPDADLSAWAVVGLGTAANIGRELGLIPERRRRRLIGQVGRLILKGGA